MSIAILIASIRVKWAPIAAVVCGMEERDVGAR